MLLVALTGNIASGKSEVARVFAARGARVIDADVLAREVVEPGTPALAEIAARWGTRILHADGSLDRAALRRIVFADPAEREALNAIVHPRVEARRRELLAAAEREGVPIVVADIPLLFEVGLADRFDRVVLVDASESARRQRLVTHRGVPEADARAMIASQMPAAEKRKRAHIVIENDGTLDELRARAERVWDMLAREARTADGHARVRDS